MFMTGLETDLEQLKKKCKSAFAVVDDVLVVVLIAVTTSFFGASTGDMGGAVGAKLTWFMLFKKRLQQEKSPY